MGLLSRIAAAFGAPFDPDRHPRTRDVAMNDPAVWLGAGVGRPAISGMHVTESEVMQLGIVPSIALAIAGPVSTIPLKVFERQPGDNRREATDLPLYTVLHRRPGRRTAQELREALTLDLALRRECFAEIIPAEGAPVAGLDYIENHRILGVAEGPDRRVYYRIAGRGTAPAYTLRDDEIWHVRRPPFTANGLRGRPIWETTPDPFAYGIALRRYGATWFRNAGRGGDILEMPPGNTFKSKEEETEFLARWRDGANGFNAHSTRLLKNGIKRSADVANNNEAQFMEAQQASNIEICGLFAMPLSRVGLLGKAIKATVEQESIDYVHYCIGAPIVALEQAACRDLLIGAEQDRYYVEHNVAGLLRGDIKTRYAAYAQGRQWGWLSVNDIRRMENLNGIGEDGDRYLEPVNMVEAGAADDLEDPPNPDPEQ